MSPHKLVLQYGDRTNNLIWALAIICAGFAVAVILTGVAIFAIYLAYQPKAPCLRLATAQLERLEYDQMGLLTTQMSLTLVAENRNTRAHASFSDLAMSLRFQGIDLAALRASDFMVEKNGSAVLNYVARSEAAPLNEGGREALEASLKTTGVFAFRVEGQARARWMVGGFVSVKVWTRLSCEVRFGVGNGNRVGLLYCDSKQGR